MKRAFDEAGLDRPEDLARLNAGDAGTIKKMAGEREQRL